MARRYGSSLTPPAPVLNVANLVGPCERKALNLVHRKTCRHLRRDLSFGEAAARVADGCSDVRLNLGFTEAELRVISWALIQAGAKRCSELT